MVFGRSKQPEVNGLKTDEEIAIKWKGKEGLIRGRKTAFIVTNQRLLYVDRDDKSIIREWDISTINAVVRDRSFATHNDGGLRAVNGAIDFFQNGHKVGWTGIMENPDDFVNSVHQCRNAAAYRPQTSNQHITSADDHVTQTGSTRGSLPKGFTATTTQPSTQPSDEPLKILKLRFAKGEITKEEFEEMKKVLE